MTTDKVAGSQESNSVLFLPTAYYFANLGIKTALIYSSVAVVTKPWQGLLTQVQSGMRISISGGLYRGFFSYAFSGHNRGILAITHKQTQRKEEFEEELQPSQFLRYWKGTIVFSQTDLMISNGLRSKSILECAGIITKHNFRWSLGNFWKLTTVNWGARSISGLINYTAIGVGGDYITSFYHFNNEIYNKLLGGATSGLFTTFLTTIPNSFGERQVLASKMENKRLVTASNLSMFEQTIRNKSNLMYKKSITPYLKANFLKEFSIRSLQNALTFSIIFGIDHALGSEPLKSIWPKRQSGFKT